MNSDIKRLVAAILVLALSVVPACSSKKNRTNPIVPPTTSFDSGNIAGGTSYAHVFATEGTFHYHCAIHPSMTGTVIVTQSGAVNSAVSIVNPTTGFSPDTIGVGKGGIVTWTNNDTATHTVTSNP